jgi:DNA-binding PadR family transcriptional regulator
MYELIILSLLMRGATHGYVIAQVINDVIGPFARASNGRIYPVLTKLQDQGLISVHEEAASEGGRVSRAFAITRAGRARFRELMLDTASSPREYRDVFAFKVSAFDQLEPADRVALLEHYIEFSRAHVRHLQHEAADLASATEYGHSDSQRARFASVFGHLIEVWQREAAWAAALLLDEQKPARKPDVTTARPRARSRSR